MVRWSSFIPAKFKNVNAGEKLKSIDTDSDGKYTNAEVKDALPGVVKLVVGKKLNNLSSLFDKDNDNKVSKEEIDSYLKENYGISYSEAETMKIGELTDYIQDKTEEKKKQKK